MQGNEKSAGNSQKKSWFQGLHSEFKKIIWPDRKTLTKQTIAVVVVSAILAVIVSLMDAAILEGINLLVK
jgi:preprotein translocase subunit SecE